MFLCSLVHHDSHNISPWKEDVLTVRMEHPGCYRMYSSIVSKTHSRDEKASVCLKRELIEGLGFPVEKEIF